MEEKYCLCCGKKIDEGLWHKSCAKHFFGVDHIPEIFLDANEIEKIAVGQLENKLSIAGVQEKLSLHLDKKPSRRSKLTIIGYPSGYILKPQSSRFKQLPEFEHTAMLLAEECGLKVVPHGLIEINDKKELAYITKRIDRNKSEKIHMEDFAQASLTLTSDKYRSSYEECALLIDKYSKENLIDKINLFKCLYFSFIIGNSDVHLKNFSFIMDNEGKLSLSSFYDLMPTKVILPSDQDELGMRLNGKKKNLTKADFDAYASNIGISINVKESIINFINGKKDILLEMINHSLINQDAKTKWKSLIIKNIKRIENNK